MFSKDEILNVINQAEKNNCQIIMTEKDYYKIKDFNIDKIKYLKVVLKIKDYENFITLVKNIL